jgi:hypothetical protein
MGHRFIMFYQGGSKTMPEERGERDGQTLLEL